MEVGLLRINDPADFIVVKDLTEFKVTETFINGSLVASEGSTHIENVSSNIINQFNCTPVSSEHFMVSQGPSELFAIGALDGQLITEKIKFIPVLNDGNIVADIKNDILKIAVINRYHPAKPAVAFIKNFGLRLGAIASSVAHDSHNIVVIGTTDESMAKAANLVIRERGGVSAVSDAAQKVLGLPVAGLMSERDGYEVAKAYTELDRFVKQELGSTLTAPFMTLSFMALLVIPHLKLSDKGLFDGDTFSFISN
jgi:adenine deaminase